MNTALVSVIIGIIVAITGYLLRKSIFDKVDEMIRTTKELSIQFTNFEKDVIKSYVTKDDYAKNEVSHEKLWTELNDTKQRVTAVETVTKINKD